MSRRKAREFALQMLFQQEVTQDTGDQVGQLFWESNVVAVELRNFADILFEKSLEGQEGIDDLISRHSDNWEIQRIAAVDRNVLRMGITELLFLDTPSSVVISEAMEIARKYGTEGSAKFVNGVLDAIRREVEEQELSG